MCVRDLKLTATEKVFPLPCMKSGLQGVPKRMASGYSAASSESYSSATSSNDNFIDAKEQKLFVCSTPNALVDTVIFF